MFILTIPLGWFHRNGTTGSLSKKGAFFTLIKYFPDKADKFALLSLVNESTYFIASLPL